MSPSMRLKRSQ
uniref:Uncharacterized protein n=1 Tax=Arundo donax TaxID=35708 RepID=A0A0A8ZMQ9_ARUDO